MHAWFAQLLETYGYWAVALVVMGESLGLPVPGETLLLLGTASAGAGYLEVWGVIGAAAGGAIVGDSLGYALGRWGGRPLLERYGRVLHLQRNCSTWFEQRADRRKGLLDGLICRQALAFAGIDNRAHSRKQVASPVGPKAIGDLPKDCTHANGLLAGVVGGWDRSVFQEQEEIVLDCGVAFLQALALRGLRL